MLCAAPLRALGWNEVNVGLGRAERRSSFSGPTYQGRQYKL